jgi:putative FmdB family regulatory protein
MPTYDYVCDACEHAFELFQGISAPVEKKCPKCKKPKLRRLFGTGGAIMFKGSGFYKTDYRSEAYTKAAKSDSSSSESSTPKPADGSGKSAKSSDGGSSKSSGKGSSKPKSRPSSE